MIKNLEPLNIGGLELKVPIVQGGMGVKVSTASLASAVADYGGAGTIASVGLGYGSKENETNFIKASREGFRKEIRQSRDLTEGVVCVNIMVALSNYEDLVRTAVEENSDVIVSGAGLPLRLPEFAEGSESRLVPIVSSDRAADIIIKSWKKRYNRLPDAVIVEGPLAGGHLGFKTGDLNPIGKINLEDLVTDVLKVVKGYEKEFKTDIPVIAAGGIFYGSDIAKFLKLGARGVQMATRFVTTFECPISDNVKELYIAAEEKDVVIIESPIGLPGRVIRTKFIDRVEKGETVPIKCQYRCIRTCDPSNVPYCIAKALFNAVIGDLDNAIVFAGNNVSKVKKIVSVKELMDEIVAETIEALNKSQ